MPFETKKYCHLVISVCLNILKKFKVLRYIADKSIGEIYQEREMTITPYQIDSVLSAYTRQSKLRVSHNTAKGNAPDGKYTDVVSLSVKEESKAEDFDQISYNLRDVILKK
jgi:hypothetical protein